MMIKISSAYIPLFKFHKINFFNRINQCHYCLTPMVDKYEQHIASKDIASLISNDFPMNALFRHTGHGIFRTVNTLTERGGLTRPFPR